MSRVFSDDRRDTGKLGIRESAHPFRKPDALENQTRRVQGEFGVARGCGWSVDSVGGEEGRMIIRPYGMVGVSVGRLLFGVGWFERQDSHFVVSTRPVGTHVVFARYFPCPAQPSMGRTHSTGRCG